MVNVKYISNTGSSTKMFKSNDTIADVIEKFGAGGMVTNYMFEGQRLDVDDLEREISDFGDKEDYRLTRLAKMDNAVDVSIVGAVAVVESKLTLDQIKNVNKYRPDALTVVDKNDDPVFVLDVCDEPEGCLNKYGAEFGTATSMSGNATITIALPDGTEDPVEYVADKFGGALNYISKLEENALAQLEDIQTECQAVRNMISRA